MNDNEMRSLIDWYLTCDRTAVPDFPFQLTPWQTVTGALFFDSLTRESLDAIDFLKGDRATPPIRLSGLLEDLKALQSLTQAEFDDW